VERLELDEVVGIVVIRVGVASRVGIGVGRVTVEEDVNAATTRMEE
jgi:hypothetical protein